MKAPLFPIASKKAFRGFKKEQKRDSLKESLQAAIELELSTIPPYLTSALCIKPNSNRSSFQIIHSVYMEEMLHMILANNVLKAIGGSVELKEKNVPDYPRELMFNSGPNDTREVNIQLEGFTENAIDTFMQIELPEDEENIKNRRKELIELMKQPRRLKGITSEITQQYLKELQDNNVEDEADIPAGTIGEFYEDVKQHLITFCEEIGEENVFIGDPKDQITQDFYWGSGGKPIVVKTLENACDAIDLIIEQGEGSKGHVGDGDHSLFNDREEIAHYYRFEEIKLGKYYHGNDQPGHPTGDDFNVDFDDSYPIKVNCTVDDFKNTPKLISLNEEFNKHFTLMLQGLEKGMNGQMKSIYPAIMNDMHQMAMIGSEMVQTPILDENGHSKGVNGAPTYKWEDLHI